MAREPGIDGVSRFMGLRWDDAHTTRMEIRPDLMNAAGFLAGVSTYAMIDYTMGSALWRETDEHEGIATLNIAINYVQTALEGEVVCTAEVDRRNRGSAVLRSEVRHTDGRLIATAVGSYVIFRRRDRPRAAGPGPGT
jgi:uncharacterized protein (TIGR00369 family)